MVFSGTAVTRGRGRAVVTATGMATDMGRVATLLGRTKEEPTPRQREVHRIGKAFGAVVVVNSIVVAGAILLTADVDSASDLVDVLLVACRWRWRQCPRNSRRCFSWCSRSVCSAWLARKRS
jgi:magnesium-transporting ATPase (P-type)